MLLTLVRKSRFAAMAVALLASTPAKAQDAVPAKAPEAATAAGTVTVFAAASLRNALDGIGADWTAATGNEVKFSYAASGALAKQIENGAPADLFGSADLKWMEYAAEKKLIKPESRVALLGNALVLVASRDTSVDLESAPGFRLAEALGDSRLAMGIPGAVPAGTYAREALVKLGVWQQIESRTAGAENVRAALAFVARGEARFGIVYATDAARDPNVKVVGTFPADSHSPIVYPFALTHSSKNPLASAFLTFLTSPQAKAVFEKEGFTVLAKGAS